MYTKEILSKHPFFAEKLKTEDVSEMLDSLTGVLLRSVIIEYVHFLIDQKTPFSLCMVDLDNFKVINDNYGHKIGDGVLVGVSKDMIRYLDDYGLVGRFGGDEFILVNLRDLDYACMKEFNKEMYANYNVMRKNVELGSCNPFVTGTLGCATFPTDADNYDDLFLLVDKTLYRGKTKGRNCYIIYLESKHKNIEIRKLVPHGLYTTFHDLAMKFDSAKGVMEKLTSMYPVLEEDLRITNLFFVSSNHILMDIKNSIKPVVIPDIGALMNEDVKSTEKVSEKADIYNTNSIEDIKDLSPKLYQFLREQEFETVMITRVFCANKNFGYLMCAEPHNLRIWQEDECAILFFTGRLMAGFFFGTGASL